MEIVKGLDSLTPRRLGLSGATDAATKRYQFSFGSVSLAGFQGDVVMRL